jgi:hypothetical protein
MELIDIVRAAQGGNAIANMARTFNLSPEQAEAAINAVIPELARGIERNTLSRGGVADLVAALGNSRHGELLQNPAMFGNPGVATEGNAILGHILGTKDASRAAAQRASLSSGLGEGLIKMLLPYIAQMLMGALSGKLQGGLGDILSKIPGMPGGPNMPGGQDNQGGGMSFPQRRTTSQPRPRNEPQDGGFGNSPPFGNAPTSSGDGGFGDQGPLPLPTEIPPASGSGRNPYGDLSDIIRGGGSAGTAAAGGGALWNIVRSIFGSALGFSTKGGVMGWIFRAVILRYGWNIVRTILGGLFRR